MRLLADLCSTVEQPEYVFGRPRLPLSDMIFAAAYKVYTGFSSRRFNSDVVDAYDKGFIDATPSYASCNRYMADPALTPIIKAMVEASAAPLSAVETEFAIDTSGFSTSRFDRWHSAKWGREKTSRVWRKAHIQVGVDSKIVTAIEVTPSTVADINMLPTLLDTTAKRFPTMTEVSADKAYLSHANLRAIRDQGAYPYIPFKSNSRNRGSGLWQQLYAMFVLNQPAFYRRYHLPFQCRDSFYDVQNQVWRLAPVEVRNRPN